MTLDPRVSMYLNLAVIGLGGIGYYLGSNSEFMHSPAGMWTVLGIGCAVAGGNAILHGIPSKPGASDQFPLGPKT